MTRSAFFQPRRSKDAQEEQQTLHVKIAPKTRAAPGRRMCDEGCPGRVWSRRAGGGRSQVQRTEARTEAASGYGSYGSYRFGVPESEPTLDVLEEQLAEVMEEEELLRAKLKDVEHQLAQACGADGEDYSHRKSRLKSRVEDAAVSVRQLSQQRAQILEGTDPEVQEEQRKREEIRRFKTSAGYSTEEAIDPRMEELEQQMYDVAMELLQEKRVLAEIQSLQRQKEEVKEHRRREKTLRSDAEIIRSRLEVIGSQLKAKLREHQEANSDLAALEEERQSSLAQSPLVAERSKVHHRLNECIQLKTQLEGKVQGLYARERAKEEQRRMEEEMRRRAAEEEELRRQAEEEEEERRQKLRDERRRLKEERLQKDRKQEEVQVAAVPHISGIPELPKEPPGSAEMRLLEQTLLYCKKLLPKNHDEVQEKKPVEYNNPEGSLIIIPKEDRSEEYLFAPPKPRRHEGKIRKRPPTSKLKKSKEAQQVLLHTPLSLKLFEELRIVPPVNTSDVPATIDEVEERLAEHQEKAKRWELKRQELLEQKLQSELGKVREAQESREQERRRRLNMALMWLQDFENQAMQSEGPHVDVRGLEDLLNAAVSMGATFEQLQSAQRLLKRWRQGEAQAALAEAIDAIRALEELSEPNHITATQDLEQAILKAKKVAEELFKAASGKAQSLVAEGAAEGETTDSEETAEVNDGSGNSGNSPTGQDAEEFVPTILNLDDDEELVFDLGM